MTKFIYTSESFFKITYTNGLFAKIVKFCLKNY